MARVIERVAGLKALVGQELGESEKTLISQEVVNMFAEATGDYQWIHVDVERANRESPFGGPIAHGYLTLSLGPKLAPQIFEVQGFTTAINYGLGKVRFPSPVLVGSWLSMKAKLQAIDDVNGGVQLTMLFTFQVEGANKPACVAEVIFRYYE